MAPLVDAGFDKNDVRRYSRDAGLRTADKPSFACLSSRVPHGTPVDAQVLARIETAEEALRALGFRQFRVRHHETVARVEVGEDELQLAFEQRRAIGERLQSAGYMFVALDVFGYRTGSLNRLLRRPS